jgi:membrane fusion protein, multidrug efflux system
VSAFDLSPADGAPAITAAYRRSTTGRVRASVRWLRRHWVLVVAAPAAVALAAAGAAYYWTFARFVVSTDDAYVQADSTLVAPRVSGYVAQVLIEDHQPVRSGQVLARLDEKDFRAAWDQTRAEVQASGAEVSELQAQLAEQRTADLARDRAAPASAEGQVTVLQAKIVQAQALRERSQAIERQAALKLGYTTIVAPIDGVVAARTIRVGQYVQAGTQLMALVPLHDVYVTANFKETQLTHVRAGQPVRLRVDSFPEAHLQACVESLAPASGLEFSLLPPDNATGNFTKIVQRIPVRIHLDSHDPLIGSLRPGMSVEASIDTRPAARSTMTAGCDLPFAAAR